MKNDIERAIERAVSLKAIVDNKYLWISGERLMCCLPESQTSTKIAKVLWINDDEVMIRCDVAISRYLHDLLNA